MRVIVRYLQTQFKLGNIDNTYLEQLVIQGKITPEEVITIVGV